MVTHNTRRWWLRRLSRQQYPQAATRSSFAIAAIGAIRCSSRPAGSRSQFSVHTRQQRSSTVLRPSCATHIGASPFRRRRFVLASPERAPADGRGRQTVRGSTGRQLEDVWRGSRMRFAEPGIDVRRTGGHVRQRSVVKHSNRLDRVAGSSLLLARADSQDQGRLAAGCDDRVRRPGWTADEERASVQPRVSSRQSFLVRGLAVPVTADTLGSCHPARDGGSSVVRRRDDIGCAAESPCSE